jgi:predicted glycosyltransferase
LEDQYYFKELDQYFPARLDILLYAHDGRGLGHASRTIGIGMALKRLYPDLKVLFVSGTNISQSLIGQSTLDWIKLPSYASRIKNGVSTGVDGPANFHKSVLGHHRSQMLAQIIESFKPKCVLVDHSPLGKREELMTALKKSQSIDIRWILGLRAVIGNPKNFWSDLYRQTFETYYHYLFWYGDQMVLGKHQIKKIENHFGRTPKEIGYVSRMYETKQLLEKSENTFTGTISLPWLSLKSQTFIQTLKQTLALRDQTEKWKIFINNHDLPDLKKLFADLANVCVQHVGEEYAHTILNSEMAVIYGGYNSLMDVTAAGIPAIVVIREMKDQEQDEHIRQLLDHDPDTMVMAQESHTDVNTFNQAISLLLKHGSKTRSFNIQGSSKAARELVKLL